MAIWNVPTIHEYSLCGDAQVRQQRGRGDGQGAPGQVVDDGPEHDQANHPPPQSSDHLRNPLRPCCSVMGVTLVANSPQSGSVVL